MSSAKIKLLISDIFLYGTKNKLDSINLEQNILDCKKVNKQLKAKLRDVEKKKAASEDTTNSAKDVSKLESAFNELYRERLFLLTSNRVFTPEFVNTRFEYYRQKVDGYKQVYENNGKKDYEDYVAKYNGNKTFKVGANHCVLSEEDFRNRCIGNHEKSNVEKKLTYALFTKYENCKNDSETLDLEIIEKETLLKRYRVKREAKPINIRQMHTFIARMRCLIKMYIDDIKLITTNESVLSTSNSDGDGDVRLNHKIYTFSTLLKSRDFRSSRTDVYKNMVKFSSYYKLIVDKSKDEKGVAMDVLDAPENKDVKNFFETDRLLKFVIDKNGIGQHYNKEYKDLAIDTKIKNLLTYLIVVHFYNDILPLINITTPFSVSHKKKVVIKDQNGKATTTEYVNSNKNAAPILSRLNHNVIESLWTKRVSSEN